MKKIAIITFALIVLSMLTFFYVRIYGRNVGDDFYDMGAYYRLNHKDRAERALRESNKYKDEERAAWFFFLEMPDDKAQKERMHGLSEKMLDMNTKEKNRMINRFEDGLNQR
jgi:hypothetical protein